MRKNIKSTAFILTLGFGTAIFGCKPSATYETTDNNTDVPESNYDSYMVKVGTGTLQEWYDEPGSVPGVKGTVSHRSSDDPNLFKYFSSKDDKPFYYNSRHGYYVLLPDGLGYNQSGENVMGAHSNTFYNNDTSLVISVSAMFYDVVLDDYPDYADSLKAGELQFLTKLGNHKTIESSPYEWISEGLTNHSDSDNPTVDRFIRKWLLKKDISDRECSMELTIFFNDSLSYRLSEFEKIIKQFPDIPASLK